MRIFVTGQVTVHWGRLEFGNIGNYYITETTFRELHRVFPSAEIVTTFQMTEEFIKREKIQCLPMEIFYSWSDNDLNLGLKELGIASIYKETGKLVDSTPFIEEVLKSDLIIDFSGELWGDHAEPVGKNRFLIGLIKNRVAQLLNKPTVLLAGSQGPFTDDTTKNFAKLVFKNFKLISNRESASAELLENNGFDISKVQNFTDPAFLFEAKPDSEMSDIFAREKIIEKHRKTVGFILCGFNMLEGPYDKWPRKDSEFTQFAKAVEYIVDELGARVVLLSHQNGFELSPNFKLINGRDYPYAKRLQEVVKKRGKVDTDQVLCIDRPYLPFEIKAIIKQFDMFISGRIHGFVAAVSQNVPTVIINRGHGPISHRNIGFARSVGFEEFLANPHSEVDIISKIQKCWENKDNLRNTLENRIPIVKETAHKCYDSLLNLNIGQ